MIGWRRAAAWLGAVVLMGIMGVAPSLGAQSISLIVSPLRADSTTPAPSLTVTALNPLPNVTYSITLELSTEAAFTKSFYFRTSDRLTETFQLDSLLPEHAPIFMRSQLLDGTGRVVAETRQMHIVQTWVTLDLPAQQSLVILNTRRPTFAWSSPAITFPPGLWQYDLSIINTATKAEQLFPFLSDTSFTPDSLEANTSYSWRVTARGQNSKGSTDVTVKSAGTFVISSPTQPTVTIFYQNFPDPFGRGQLSPQTCFWFDLDRAATVRLTVFDIRLRRVRQIVPGAIGNGQLGPGSYGRQAVNAPSGCDSRLTWDGRDDRGQYVPPGVYAAEFVVNGKSTVIKMMYKGAP
jgi:hypothetical protein